jgi:hypothetical protein
VSDPDLLSRAIVVWYDPDLPYPAPRDERVVAEFGEEQGRELLPQLKAIRAKFLESDAYATVADLPEMAEKARSDFSTKHPEVSSAALELLATDYAFTNK